MIELFADLPVVVKEEIAKIIDTAFDTLELRECAELIAEFAKNCSNQEEQDFIDFYFNLKLEQMKNEDNSN